MAPWPTITNIVANWASQLAAERLTVPTPATAASEARARTVAVTNHSDSPLARAADIVLTTAARESPFRSGALGSRMAQMMIIDCLFVGVAQQSYDSSIEALRKTYLAVQGRKVPQGGQP